MTDKSGSKRFDQAGSDEFGCEGDPHSPYPHDWRRVGVDQYARTVYRCSDCGAVEAIDEDEREPLDD